MVHDMYEYMRIRETAFLVCLQWDQQPELSDNIRRVLIDWLHELMVEKEIESETLHLTVSLIDRLLMMCSVSQRNVQLVGTAALMIASKYEQIYPPELDEFVYATDDSYSKSEILRMESKMLNYLRFDISVPTVEWFVSHLLNATKPSKTCFWLAHYLGDLSLLLTSLNGLPPSVIAAASLTLSNLITGHSPWTDEMEKMTGISLSQLEKPMAVLLGAFNAASHSVQRSMFEKYCGSEYEEVAVLPSPSALPSLH
ncbi:hypothetical protein PMAYCL1PPCAC_22633 [Pristionchus mayeri]|uniref:Cyclin N-terminal domain-containing protein n=1 Tax=Pristionchus mayeri TaxID=1317129 RepID=A0AAN5I500_9BILA|nr:hypothetical protein PMAYCL1PPCAC_22633 [Pristionchus mayeri]